MKWVRQGCTEKQRYRANFLRPFATKVFETEDRNFLNNVEHSWDDDEK